MYRVSAAIKLAIEIGSRAAAQSATARAWRQLPVLGFEALYWGSEAIADHYSQERSDEAIL